MTGCIDLDVLLDAVIDGIKSGDRIERDPRRLAGLLDVEVGEIRARFPDDDALFVELIVFVFGAFGAKLAGEGDTSGRSLAERYVDISVPAQNADWAPPERKAEALMLLTLVNPAAMRVAQQTFATWQSWVNEAATTPAGGHLLRFLADGWWFTEAYNFGPPIDAATRRAVRTELDAIARTYYPSDGDHA